MLSIGSFKVIAILSIHLLENSLKHKKTPYRPHPPPPPINAFSGYHLVILVRKLPLSPAWYLLAISSCTQKQAASSRPSDETHLIPWLVLGYPCSLYELRISVDADGDGFFL